MFFCFYCSLFPFRVGKKLNKAAIIQHVNTQAILSLSVLSLSEPWAGCPPREEIHLQITLWRGTYAPGRCQHAATGPQPKHRKPRRPELYVPYRSFEPCPTGTIVYLEKSTYIFFWTIQHKASNPTHSRTMKSEAENIFHQNNHFPGRVSNENVFI